MNNVHEQCLNSDLNSAQNSALHQVRSQRQSRSRHSISTGQVGTSNQCRDQPLLLPQKCPCRDLEPWSRHQTTIRQPEPCRNIKSVSRHHSEHSRSRPQNGVATLFLLPSPKPGRDIKTRSRLSWRLTYVVTSSSCRDLISAHSGISRSRRQTLGHDLPHCYPCRDLKNDVATSKMMSRPQLSSAPFLLRRDAIFSMSQPLLLPPMLRPQN